MAKFSDTEKKLLESISDDRLLTSLSKIREAMEDIWSSDAPRIIQDYTDHGVEHCKRLASFASKLLEANDGSPLSSQEMYLLLASIYLHDIGMQCDVLKFPEIKAVAESLGAKFDIEFQAKTTSSYTIEEQISIRKNHQFLSISWIDYAHRTGNTTLGLAAKTVPEELVDDLMDICKHHTKAPITDCPMTFKFDPTQRKQLIAALLRFSDELDIDGHRVNLEAIKNYSLDPRNSVFWWLHNRTKIIFVTRNVVLITIRLNPEDQKQHGSFVRTAFISEFQTKNRPTLTVLATNGIPIDISAQSNIIEDNRSDLLPLDIIQALKIMQKKKSPLFTLAEEVRIWLQAIRYEVSEPHYRGDQGIDMIATLDQGTLKQRVLVRCIDGEIMTKDVDELDKILDRKTPQGWLITDKRVSENARSRAAEDDAFRVFNLSEFLQQLVWKPYFDALKALAEKDSIPELYVDLACYKQEMDEKGEEKNKEKHESLDSYIDLWLKERGKVHISLLGEFGTGKTWFCRHYAYRQLKRYLEDPANERLPLLITLRSFAKAMTSQQLINDALLEQYKLPFVGSAYEVFQEMNRRGKLLLILDGFDEMARQVDYQTVVDNFWELANLVEEGSKAILTSRTEYFRWAEESKKIFSGEEYGRGTIVLTPPKFEVLHLEPFSPEQIRQVIIGRIGKNNGTAIADKILKAQNLAEMAQKPILIELLLAALDEVEGDALENPTQVYLYATNKLLLRNIDTQRTFTATSDKVFFLCELAWEMIRSGELRVHYASIPDRIKTYFGERIKDQHELDTWDFDLRSQTLLHRNAAGYYEFAHKSLAEYFVAFKFANELGCLANVFKNTYCESNGKPCELPGAKTDIAFLVETFGTFNLASEQAQAVRDLMLGMMDRKLLKRLWKIITYTKEKNFDETKYLGGNAATLLNKSKTSFAKADLENTILCEADLFGCDLSTARVKNCNLENAKLNNSKFTSMLLTSAKLKNTGITIYVHGKSKAMANIPDNTDMIEMSEKQSDIIHHIIPALMSLLGARSATSNVRHINGEEFIVRTNLGVSSPVEWGKRKKDLMKKGILESLKFNDYQVLGAAIDNDEINELKRLMPESFKDEYFKLR
ncbi:MAG: NACHT domain-containing protein [Anaerolineae bacterium]|nr:NACHT domain-containing protein [Anaerolineae bacterium]